MPTTQLLDRTPIVRVKLAAPGEDNGNVVKKQQSSRFTLYAMQLFLKLILQKQKMSLWNISIKFLTWIWIRYSTIKMYSWVKTNSRKTYDFVPEFATADEAKQHAVYAWDGKDNADYSLDPNFKPEEYNQLFVSEEYSILSSWRSTFTLLRYIQAKCWS